MIYFVEDSNKYAQRQLAHMLLVYGLYREYGIAGEILVKRREKGKPYLAEHPDICFNYSHSRQGVLCGIDEHEIGVDIEGVISYREALAKKISHPNEWDMLLAAEEKEQLLTRIWIAKESYLKFTGDGIRGELRQLDFSVCQADLFMAAGCLFQLKCNEQFGMAVCGGREEYHFVNAEEAELEKVSENAVIVEANPERF